MIRVLTAIMTAAILMSAGAVCAQPLAPIGPPPAPGTPRPTFSPYLNLARRGTNPALNYYGLVRPEMQFRRNIQNLQNQVAVNQQTLNTVQEEIAGIPGTGHPTQFMNYGGYFLNSGPNVGAGVGAAAPITAPRAQLFTPPTGGGPRR